MIIFRESGRLGNQIFQYLALRTICRKNEKLILLGFKDLQEVFSGINADIINASSTKYDQSIYTKIYKSIDYLSKINIFSRISESMDSSEKPKIISNSALFPAIQLASTSYFQHQTSFNIEATGSLDVAVKYLDFAKGILEISGSATPIFVHIRRGDYLRWPDSKNPAVLPANYYRKCIRIIQSNVPRPFFFFTSDDPYYVEDVFGKLKNSFISKFSSYEDFAIMTQCHGGILSASSFSWWAAYFSRLRYPGSIFLAPEYWGGHRTGSWFPPFIESTFLRYVTACESC